jgi:hypothetical protein
MKSFRDDDNDNNSDVEDQDQEAAKPKHTKNSSSVIDFNQNIVESSRLHSEMADFDNTAQDIPQKRMSRVEGNYSC